MSVRCRYLYATLAREPVITNSNKARVVEVVRSIAEVVIYGEQNQQAAVFDYFAEVNMLANFVKILAQRCDNKVKVRTAFFAPLLGITGSTPTVVLLPILP